MDQRVGRISLMPFVAQVAVGKRTELQVYGNDYATPDGTGVRDYIHVVDLALGHVKALERPGDSGLLAVNRGTGQGYSVLDMVRAFEKASGRKVPYKVVARRPGDPAVVYADPLLAHDARLQGYTGHTNTRLDRGSLRWQTGNLEGFRDT